MGVYNFHKFGTRNTALVNPGFFSTSNLGSGRTAAQQGPVWDERGFPERIEANAVGLLHEAVRVPASVLQAPVSLATGGNLRGVLAHGGDPDAPDPVGGFVGDVLSREANAIPALVNSGDAKILAALVSAGLPDSAVLDQGTLDKLLGQGPLSIAPVETHYKNGVPVLGALPFLRHLFHGEPMTVADFKNELVRRGFLREGETWESVAGQAAQDPYAFGDRAINDSAMVDLIGRLGMDPLMWVPGVGPFTGLALKGLRVGATALKGVEAGAGILRAETAINSFLPNAARAAWSLAPSGVRGATSGVLRSGFGVGYVRDAVTTGLKAAQTPAPRIAAEAIANGEYALASKAGWANYLGRVATGTARNVFLPGKGNLLQRYVRGGVHIQLAEAGTDLLTGAFLTGDERMDNPFLSQVHDIANSLANDRPLSDESWFLLASAFGTPLVPALKEDVGAIQNFSRTRGMGGGTMAQWVRAGYGGAEGWGYRQGRAAEARLLEAAGGPEAFQRLRGFLATRLAANKIHGRTDNTNLGDTGLSAIVNSSDEMAYGAGVSQDLYTQTAQEMLRRGEITEANLIREFDRYHSEMVNTLYDEAGNVIRHDVPGTSELTFPWDAKLNNWRDWQAANEGIAKFGEVGGAIVGRAERMAKEDLTNMINAVRAMSRNGNISADYVANLLRRYQAMLQDPGVDVAFWRTLLNEGVQGARPLGRLERAVKATRGEEIPAFQPHRTFNADEIAARLEDLRDRAPTRHELFHEAAVLEAKQAGLSFEPRRGFSNAQKLIDSLGGGTRSMLATRAQYKKIIEDLPAVRMAKASQEQLRNTYKQAYTNKGKLRRTEMERRFSAEQRQPAALDDYLVARKHVNDIQAEVTANEGGTWDPKTGKFYNGKRGYAVGAFKHGTFAEAKATDTTAIARATAEAMTNFPEATHVGYWLNKATGKIEIDPVRIVTKKADAEALARENLQEAYWDFKAGDSVTVNTRDQVIVQRKAAVDDWRNEVTADGITREQAWEVERQATLQRLNEMRGRITEMRRYYRTGRARVKELMPVEIDPTFLDRHGNLALKPEELATVMEQTRFINEEFPSQFTLKKGPKYSSVLYKASDGVVPAMLQERSNLARLLFDYGPVSRIGQMLQYATGPAYASERSRASRQQVFNKLVPLGFTEAEVGSFIRELHNELERAPKIGPLHAPIFRGLTGLPSSTITQVAHDTLASNAAAWSQFIAKHGNKGMPDVLASAFNSVVRRAELATLRGKNDRLANVLSSGWWAWSNTPALGSGSRFLSKVFYPLFRFAADVRWQAMNLVENDMLAMFADGARATRLNPEPAARTRYAVNVHRARSGFSVFEADPSEAALITNHAFLDPVLRRQFDVRMKGNVDKWMQEIADNDPAIQVLKSRFGDDPKGWSEAVQDTLYKFDHDGVAATAGRELLNVAKQEGWTQAEVQAFAPALKRLVDLNQRSMDDLLKMHIGNIDRSRVERLLNSYWLYWPISYQIKATKWMLGVMSNKSYGFQTNFGQAWNIDRLSQEFKRKLQDIPEFRRQFTDEPTLWLMASMMFPITPFDVGVSLNRGVRYVGGNALGWWPDYNLTSPFDGIGRMVQLGPIYTVNLLGRASEEFNWFDGLGQSPRRNTLQ